MERASQENLYHLLILGITDMTHAHYVEYDENQKKIIIYRYYTDTGKKVLYTEVDFSDILACEDVFTRLGEVLCIDSEVMRNLLKM